MRLRIWSLYKIKRRPSFLGVVCSPTSLQVSKFGFSVALSLPGCTAWPLPCERTMCCSPPGLDVHLPWKGFFSPQPLALLAWTLSLASFGWWFTRTRSISAGTETELLRWPTLLSFHFRATFHLLLLTCKGHSSQVVTLIVPDSKRSSACCIPFEGCMVCPHHLSES